MKALNLKDLLTIKEVAAILNVTVQRVHQMIAEGKIKGEKLAPGLWVTEKASVEKYIEDRRERLSVRGRS